MQLADVEKRKRELEDANKRKKIELLKAIQERKSKTMHEAAILNQIQVC